MARTARDTRLDTRNARLKLKPRREPYWRTISGGMAVGYRRGAKGGTWIARHYAPESGRRYESLGVADDKADADGHYVLSFSQAQDSARKWFGHLARQDSGEVVKGSYTVKDAMADYLKDYKRRSGKGTDRVAYTIDAHILPALGGIELARLTRSKLENWLHGLAETAGRIRVPKGKAPKTKSAPTTAEAKRRRKATANRCFTVLKAALNHAHLSIRIQP